MSTFAIVTARMYDGGVVEKARILSLAPLCRLSSVLRLEWKRSRELPVRLAAYAPVVTCRSLLLPLAGFLVGSLRCWSGGCWIRLGGEDSEWERTTLRVSRFHLPLKAPCREPILRCKESGISAVVPRL